LYDGPFCVLSIVDNRAFKRLCYADLDHELTHRDIRRFFRRFRAALTGRGLTLRGITTDGLELYPQPIAQVFGAVEHQVCRFHILALQSLTLNPKHHPGSCAQKQVVIEDLLAIELQKQFFEQCPDKWCTAVYKAGAIRRFQWKAQSKGALQEYACREGSWKDFGEIARVLRRGRSVVNFPAADGLLREEVSTG
jgi:hypothetical protein